MTYFCRNTAVRFLLFCYCFAAAYAFSTPAGRLQNHCNIWSSTVSLSSFPSSAGDDSSQQDYPQEQQQQEGEEEKEQAHNRFSKFAPDPNLSADDFRSQLKENMKAELEKRRREDPNRGNQISKSYLDSL